MIKSKHLALVTGATSGIGKAIAEALAERGVHLVIAARDAEALDELARLWQETYGISVRACRADLTREEDVDRLWATTLREACAQEIDFAILVNNAGAGLFAPFCESEEGRLTDLLRLNAAAPTVLMRRAAEHFKAAGRGRILNIASTAAMQSMPGLAVYAATKAYLLSLSEALSYELRGTGVTVTCCCPGPVRTNFGTAAGLREESPFNGIAMTPDVVARFALEALWRGDAVAVPGWTNRIGAWLAKRLPASLVTRIAARAVQKLS